jgi:protein O-GlcNAc transferase
MLRLPIGSNGWWDMMRAQILSKHRGDLPEPSASRPVITYLSRQSTDRRLTDQGHLDVVEELQAIAKTGKAEYHLEVFEDVPVPEQWARIARTTVCRLYGQYEDAGRLISRQILVGVHGNGLTHTIFMPGFPGSAVYEMQPEHCHIVRSPNHVRPLGGLLDQNDFSPLAQFRNISHWIVQNDQ